MNSGERGAPEEVHRSPGVTAHADSLIDAEVDVVPPPVPPVPESRAGIFVVATCLLLAALNLRPPVTSIAPVLPEIVDSTGMNSLAASVLTTLPVFCFGLFGPLGPVLSRRFGTERAMLVALAALTTGVGLRGIGGATALFAGQLLASIAIGVMNILSPGLVKRDFPNRLPLMTGLYTMALCAGAAIAAGATVPLARLFGDSWEAALSSWAVPAAAATLLWMIQMRPQSRTGSHVAYRVTGLWTDPLAWQVTLFMGLQSALAFTVFGWLAPILRARGLTPVDAGLAVSISVGVQTVAALFAPVLAARGRDQRPSCIAALVLCVAGLIGCLYAPLSGIWFWAVVLGLAQGSLFSLALMLIVLRSPDSHVAAHLSSMAQSLGYLLAATGPMLTGLLHGWYPGVTPVALLCTGFAAGGAIAALGAGRSAHVGAMTIRLPD